MAYGKKTGGKDFQPGESGNPGGRPTLPDEIKEARKLNKSAFEIMLNKYIHMSLTEIQAAATSPDTPAIEILIAKVLAEGIKRGDEKRLDFIVTRLVGSVKKQIVLEGGDEDSPPIKLSAITPEERAEWIRIARGEKKNENDN